MEKGTTENKTTKKRQQISVTVTVSKELGGVECAKYLLSIASYKSK
jgi:hypothetical protein